MYVGYRYASLSIEWNSIILDDPVHGKVTKLFTGVRRGIINNLESNSQASL